MRQQLRITGRALKRWFLAQCLDSLIVAAMWWLGLALLGVPWAPLWAFFAAIFQFIPHIGGVLTLIGPLGATLLEGNGWEGTAYVLGLYAVVMVLDGFIVQPMILKRTARVPVWASIVVPLVMGYFFQFWGILLSAPMLAVFFALKAHRQESRRQLQSSVQILPPAVKVHRRAREVPPAVIES
ncbi:putative transporter [Candidatus Koribacter versatilis Ellin345]|uniref:Transporter n=1 Tax=Koribacter versatilis (strain Ellin345) TaxID=204669 RepID=Q1IPG5_KORVE|nr:AI-2E family transporter [Candidatus Koribacter versatilis]ABF41235.1 putative transporter [Candidatus Koribacter versatilis Ellin345]